MPDPDGDVLLRACSGDEGAFIDLYERHRRPLFRFAYRMLGSVSSAEDVTHECFVFLLTQPGRFDPERAPLRTFLWGVVRNLALKQLRQRGHDTTHELPESWEREPTEPAAPLRQLLDKERSEAVQEAVAALPPLQREVIVLFEYEGQSLAEIAAVVAADTGTVKARLHRARERLRRALASQLSGMAPARPRSLEKMA
jgi:RNA polymerase sigma-70 factor (ECF subfamily)